jgi:hypothetical protein
MVMYILMCGFYVWTRRDYCEGNCDEEIVAQNDPLCIQFLA